MNVEAIREFCLAFPKAKENLQWGDDLCFKVGGKILPSSAWTIRGFVSSARQRLLPN
jgi:hypothetical protein